MELKTLILGLFVSFAAFALKAGGGLAYLFSTRETAKDRAFAAALFALVYALVFFLAGLILSGIDLTAHMDQFQTFFKSGMFMHFALALLLIIWGARLVSTPGKSGNALQGVRQDKRGTKSVAPGEPHSTTRGWIPLVIPCPVCFTVILLSVAFLHILYPGHPGLLWALYLFFVLVSLGVAWPLSFAMDRFSPEPMLGTLMLYLSAYFLLTIFMVPAFSDLDKIYRISLPDAQAGSISTKGLMLACGALAAVVIGFVWPKIYKKESK